MKHIFTLLLIYLVGFHFSSSNAQTYTGVLFRVNAGGGTIPTIDTSAVDWASDGFHNPSPYIDTNVIGNKTYGTTEDVTANATVPASTPLTIFKMERDLGSLVTNQLEYNFPVASGQGVEVRLYFDEIYLNAAGERIFDIYIEGQPVLTNLDIFAEVGRNVGMMKKFLATSDGNLDIDFRSVLQLPKVNGIEIIGTKEGTIQGVFNGKQNSISISAYPNPFSDQVTLEVGSNLIEGMQLFNGMGSEIPVDYTSTGSKVSINMENLPKGIYYLNARINNHEPETVRLIKQ